MCGCGYAGICERERERETVSVDILMIILLTCDSLPKASDANTVKLIRHIGKPGARRKIPAKN